MSKNLYAIYCVLSIDHSKKENLIISSKNDKIALPIFEIEHPKLMHNELRYHLQGMLLDNTYDPNSIKNMIFSYLDIQNNLVLQYLDNEHEPKIDTENNIFILCGIILENPYPLKTFKWTKFDFIKSFNQVNIINSIIDFIVQKSIA